jgi:hypothetical protein
MWTCGVLFVFVLVSTRMNRIPEKLQTRVCSWGCRGTVVGGQAIDAAINLIFVLLL